MKMLYAILFVFLALLTSCGSTTATVVENKNDTVTPSTNITKIVTATPKEVRIVFSVQATYPQGAISPDAVFMDNKPLQDGVKIWTGVHTFVIEKKGYQKVTKAIEVDDPEGDREFPLAIILEPKPRLVLFDITDKITGKPVVPDQVIIVARSMEAEGNQVSHQSYVQPGAKKMVIQKKGYQSISEDINIKPDEEPYLIQYQMVSK